METYSFVYFDVGGVIFDFRPSLQALSKRINLGIDVVMGFFHTYDDALCKGELSPNKFLHILEVCSGETAPFEDFVEFWVDHFQPITTMHNLLLSLSAEGVNIGLLTNIYPGTFEFAISSGKIPNIRYDVVVKSYEEGLVKPDPNIFRRAELKTGRNPQEIIFVDDSARNIEIARSLGWNCFYFDSRRAEETVQEINREIFEHDLSLPVI